jgi:hypothetical protein
MTRLVLAALAAILCSAALVRMERDRYGKLIREAGIKAN